MEFWYKWMICSKNNFFFCTENKETCKKRFYLLTLAEKGHRVSKDKLQICQNIDHYLGYDLTKEGKTLWRPKIIQEWCRPLIQWPLREWVSGFSETVTSLHEFTESSVREPLLREPKYGQAFPTSKKSPFFYFACEVCTNPWNFNSTSWEPENIYPLQHLPPWSGCKSYSACLKAGAAASKLVYAFGELVLGNPFNFMVPRTLQHHNWFRTHYTFQQLNEPLQIMLLFLPHYYALLQHPEFCHSPAPARKRERHGVLP